LSTRQISRRPAGPLLGQGRTADIYAWGENQALKLYHPGWPAAMIEAEAHISRQVAQTGLPVPAVGEVLTVDGRTGIVFSRVSVRFLMRYFETNRLTPFAWYCVIAGVLAFGYFAAQTLHLLP
jgi:hypothetical protein